LISERGVRGAVSGGRELGLDRKKTNVNGGAIALGHPLGMTGTRLLLTLSLELARRGKRYGLATACSAADRELPRSSN
jgi:acetyl-CoA acetyltransferase